MRHARSEALDELESTLERLRALPGLRETSRGVFYRGGKAFLHFHEDPTGIHADVKVGGDGFTRLRAQTAAERAAFVRQVEEALSERT
jgi:hypothetical protein